MGSQHDGSADSRGKEGAGTVDSPEQVGDLEDIYPLGGDASSSMW